MNSLYDMPLIYADGADEKGILQAAKNPMIMGFTTNPSLMRQAGVTDYMAFCNRIIPQLKELRPDTNISLEVFSDNHAEMITQAYKLHDLSIQYDYPVYVKIPCVDTNGVTTDAVVSTLTKAGVKVNVTAIFTQEQFYRAFWSLKNTTGGIISVFAGRMKDAGVDASETINNWLMGNINEWEIPVYDNVLVLWASTREVYNVIEASECYCDIITMTPDLIKKLPLFGKNLEEYSVETVKMFYNDALASGYTI